MAQDPPVPVAGRVQSVATRLVVAKERDRMAHVSAQYWSIDTAFTSAGQAFGARVAPWTATPSRPAPTSARRAS